MSYWVRWAGVWGYWGCGIVEDEEGIWGKKDGEKGDKEGGVQGDAIEEGGLGEDGL